MRLIDADLLEPDADYDDGEFWAYSKTQIDNAPTIEPLTDSEKRIFLAAMGREEEICRYVDRKSVGDPGVINLVGICKGITRKVKATLW